jgi:hypothetical protein
MGQFRGREALGLQITAPHQHTCTSARTDGVCRPTRRWEVSEHAYHIGSSAHARGVGSVICGPVMERQIIGHVVSPFNGQDRTPSIAYINIHKNNYAFDMMNRLVVLKVNFGGGGPIATDRQTDSVLCSLPVSSFSQRCL